MILACLACVSACGALLSAAPGCEELQTRSQSSARSHPLPAGRARRIGTAAACRDRADAPGGHSGAAAVPTHGRSRPTPSCGRSVDAYNDIHATAGRSVRAPHARARRESNWGSAGPRLCRRHPLRSAALHSRPPLRLHAAHTHCLPAAAESSPLPPQASTGTARPARRQRCRPAGAPMPRCLCRPPYWASTSGSTFTPQPSWGTSKAWRAWRGLVREGVRIA